MEKDKQMTKEEEVRKLIKQGSCSLVFAVAAKASMGSSPVFYSLPLHQKKKVEYLISFLAQCKKESISLALDIVFSENIVLPAPLWVVDLCKKGLLTQAVESLKIVWPLKSDDVVTGYKAGLAALSIAFCRNMDIIISIMSVLPDEEKERFWDMAHLASVFVSDGEPSKMRHSLYLEAQRLLKEDG